MNKGLLMSAGSPPPFTLSKSDFKLARTCPTKLYYRKTGYPADQSDDPYLRMLAQGGYMVEMLARLEHPEGIALEPGLDLRVAAEKTRVRLAEQNVTLFDATVADGACHARIDILKKRGAVFDLFEVKARNFDKLDAIKRREKTGSPFRSLKIDKDSDAYPIASHWLEYLEDVTYQVLVLRRLFPDTTIRPHLVLIKKEHRTGIDELPRWFVIDEIITDAGRTRLRSVRFTGDPEAIRKDPITVAVPVDDEIRELLPKVEELTNCFVKSITPIPTPIYSALGSQCRECEFSLESPMGVSGFRECWGEQADVVPSVLELYKGSTRIGEFLAEGIACLLDIPLDRLGKKDGDLGATGERQVIQITHTRAGTEWLDRRLQVALEGVKYPLHFIDFEAGRNAIPHHRGMRPYGLLAFQWSCHTVHSPGAPLEHREWINAGALWPNAEFARSLRNCVGEQGTILTWSSFEEAVLRVIGEELVQFEINDPELGAWLTRVAGTREAPSERVLDLYKLCTKYYFHPGMGASTSIKAVLDALWRTSPEMRLRFAELEGREGDPEKGPYVDLPPITINGVEQRVAEGTGAVRAYEAMVYGVERNDEAVKDSWRKLLQQYCRLDTLAMVLVWEHWTAARR